MDDGAVEAPSTSLVLTAAMDYSFFLLHHLSSLSFFFLWTESGRMEIKPTEASRARHREGDGSETDGTRRSLESVGGGRQETYWHPVSLNFVFFFPLAI